MARIIQGTGNDDYLIGFASQNDIITGFAGDDDIVSLEDIAEGFAGNDIIDGGDGNDEITTDDGSDKVLGGLGDDVIFTDGGDDEIIGDDGNDNVSGGEGNDSIFGNLGDDILNGETGDDVVLGDEGADDITGSFGSDFLSGGLDDDIINSHEKRVSARVVEKDVIFGGDGADTINLFTNYTGGRASSRPTGRTADGSFAVLADFELGTDILNVLNRPGTYSISYGNGPTSPDYDNVRGLADTFISHRGNLVAVVIDARLTTADLTQVV